MSVNSVLTGLRPPYGPLSGNNPRTAKSGTPAQESAERTFTQADPSQATDTEIESARLPEASASGGDGADTGQLQSALERALREGNAAETGRPSPGSPDGSASASSGASSESSGNRSAPAIALYQRVSQYGNNEPSTSALLKSWNEIVQGGQVADSAVARFAQTLSQSETPGLESGVLHITA